MPRTLAAALTILAIAASATVAPAISPTLNRTESGTDFVTVGLGGISTGFGTLVVEGVVGDVRKAFLYWHGLDNGGAGEVYDNETVLLDKIPVVGVSLGDSASNCWGSGSSRAYFADVTHLVTGNGDYRIEGLDAKPSHSGNGVSLIVLFNDADSGNDRDLRFYEGNDSNAPFAVEFSGWNVTLADIPYAGGSVFAEFHAGDTQVLTDSVLKISGVTELKIIDNTSLWDGKSVLDAGFSRTSRPLWDVHTFDITETLGTPGLRTVTIGGMSSVSDCVSLVVIVLSLPAAGNGTAICGDANEDGEIKTGDALLALKTGVGSGTCPLTRCDFNGDAEVTAGDALQILRTAVGQPSNPQCPAAGAGTPAHGARSAN